VRFTEIDLFGVYVAPISLMMILAWVILVPLRRALSYLDLWQFVWHPALFEFTVYVIVLSSIVLLVGH
jgi:hypothetical protein